MWDILSKKQMIHSSEIKYVKLNVVRLKGGKREQNTKLLIEFFEKINGKVKGLNGYAIMDNLGDSNETIVLTLWKSKEDLDKYYGPENKVLSDFVLKAKPNFERVPERKDYVISKLRIY
jgi:hypothetical protein